MAQKKPTPYGPALAHLRSGQNWTQAQLGEAAGVPEIVISAWERGRLLLSREELDRLAGLMDCGPDDVEAALLHVEARPEEADDLVAPSPAVRRAIRKTRLTAARVVLGAAGAALTDRAVERWARAYRARAAAHWECVCRHPAGEWRERLDERPAEDAWALAELLCAASEKAAAADVEKALFLAELALHTAGRVSQNAAWRRRMQGYCWAFVGNARRVAGKLVLADQAFEESERLWKAGKTSDPGGILDAGRLLDMKASLRRAQRRFPEALKLHEQALRLTAPARQGYILVNKSRVHEALHDHELAIEILQHATSMIDRFLEPRLVFGAQFNLAVNLCHLDRFKEADQLLPEITDLADQLGNSLDLVRSIWLKSWVATGLGRPEEAMVALQQVRREFAERRLDYDVALASLELAVLYLEQGFHTRVRILAREMAPIFEREQVHREALAALRLFTGAVIQETATADLARRIVRYLRDARDAPESRFEP